MRACVRACVLGTSHAYIAELKSAHLTHDTHNESSPHSRKVAYRRPLWRSIVPFDGVLDTLVCNVDANVVAYLLIGPLGQISALP